MVQHPVVLSDRGVDENHVAIPSLLAVSAVHQHLVKTKKSTSVAMILETGEPREVHHLQPSWLWCMCRQPISGTGYHQTLIDSICLRKITMQQ